MAHIDWGRADCICVEYEKDPVQHSQNCPVYKDARIEQLEQENENLKEHLRLLDQYPETKPTEQMVLVPEQPTNEMMIAGIDALDATKPMYVGAIYAAMIAAAQQQEGEKG